MYRTLHATNIVDTVARLQRRIEERFPGAGLSRLAGELCAVAELSGARARRLGRPFYGLRALVIGVIGAAVIAQALSARYVRLELHAEDAFGMFQGLDAAVNLLIIAGGAVWFLATLEERVKRNRALSYLHELRSLAHVADMHQLTKDPTVVLKSGHVPTPSSPARAMSEFELTRYLEYCSEMLALIGKLAALYAETTQDPVVIEAVNDLESLTANLGRKIWQKITILRQLNETRIT